jgi:hypothetical protein
MTNQIWKYLAIVIVIKEYHFMSEFTSTYANIDFTLSVYI